MHEGEFMFVLFLGGLLGLTPSRQTELLVNENEAMRGQMLRLEDRLSVMERIATDSSLSLGREIERLR